MGADEPTWIKNRVAELITQHGAVPPLWFMFPDSHPYEIVWRMGSGEGYAMVFYAWWKSQKAALDETQRVEYFRRWPPPPRWLTWMIDHIWDLHPEDLSDPESFDYSEYFERTKALGFGTQEEFDRDFNGWLEEEYGA